MSVVIEHAPTARASSAPPQATAVVQRPPRRWSSRRATERAWLQDGFSLATPDLEDFLAEAAPQALCNTHRIAAVMFLALIGLASVLHVDIVVSGSGRLSADAPTIVSQPMQLSVIRSIRVKPGDIVRKGDVLAELDPTFAKADQATLLAQQSAITALKARLDAELDDATPAMAAGPPGAPEWRLQQTLYQQHRAQFADRLADFTQKLDGLDKASAGAEQTRVSLQQQVDLSKEVENMRNSLYRSQSGSKLVYLDAQAARIRNERDLEAAIIHVNALQQDKRSILSDRQAFIDGWRRDLLEALVKVTADASALNENLTKANRLNDLVVLTAQQDGVVLEVAKRSVGSVLNAAEPLITMVPSDAAMIADISISSSDVGYLKVGDPTVIKVDAFPYQRHGFLEGRLRSVAADSSAAGGNGPATGAAYHHGQVELVSTTLKAIPDGVRLIPGMTLTAEIKVGTRSVISYLTYPITRGFSESIREP